MTSRAITATNGNGAIATRPPPALMRRQLMDDFKQKRRILSVNHEQLRVQANYTNLNLRGMILSARGKTTGTTDMTLIDVVVAPFTDSEFDELDERRGVYDPVSKCLNIVVFPMKEGEGDKRSPVDRVPADPSQRKYYPVRPLDKLFIVLFQKFIPEHVKPLSIVDLIDFSYSEYMDKNTHAIRASPGVQLLNTVTKCSPKGIYDCFTQFVPKCALPLAPIEQLKQRSANPCIIIPFNLVSSVTNEEMMNGGVMAQLIPSTNRNHYAKQDDKNKKLWKRFAVNLAGNIKQWVKLPDTRNAMAFFNMWENHIRMFGIEDPIQWSHFGEILLQNLPFIGIFGVDEDGTKSLPCNISNEDAGVGAMGSTEPAAKEAKDHYDYGLSLRVAALACDITDFYNRFLIPVDVATFDSLLPLLMRRPYPTNALNLGEVGNKRIFCINETTESVEKWRAASRDGSGTFRVLTDIPISEEEIASIASMDAKKGSEFFGKIRNRLVRGEKHFYVFFIAHDPRGEKAGINIDHTVAKSIASMLRLAREPANTPAAIESTQHPHIDDGAISQLPAPAPTPPSPEIGASTVEVPIVPGEQPQPMEEEESTVTEAPTPATTTRKSKRVMNQSIDDDGDDGDDGDYNPDSGDHDDDDLDSDSGDDDDDDDDDEAVRKRIEEELAEKKRLRALKRAKMKKRQRNSDAQKVSKKKSRHHKKKDEE